MHIRMYGGSNGGAVMNLEYLRIVVLVAGLVVLFGGGWAAMLHMKIRNLERVEKDLRALERGFSAHTVELALLHQQKDDFRESLGKIESALEKMEANFDKRMEGMSKKVEDGLKSMSDEVKLLAARVHST